VAGLAVLLTVGAFALWPQPDRVTPESFERIRYGMRRAEVRAILGPPGDYRTGPVYEDVRPALGFFSGRPQCDEWFWDFGYFVVQFDSSEAVMSTSLISTERVHQSSLDNLLWRAKRQWRKWFLEPE
jgi:hypothetical protein